MKFEDYKKEILELAKEFKCEFFVPNDDVLVEMFNQGIYTRDVIRFHCNQNAQNARIALSRLPNYNP